MRVHITLQIAMSRPYSTCRQDPYVRDVRLSVADSGVRIRDCGSRGKGMALSAVVGSDNLVSLQATTPSVKKKSRPSSIITGESGSSSCCCAGDAALISKTSAILASGSARSSLDSAAISSHVDSTVCTADNNRNQSECFTLTSIHR